eukprot:TRINITY_DN8525_c0_g1_i1.p3 TRINITY_DN8525_c0_g1~~TRINITY_DN8525_c0_g1_i1.p3  ORF type:complete len:225 (+),score=137.49 TRINITY_DN8525_c0_g1_i1:57-731(+)
MSDFDDDEFLDDEFDGSDCGLDDWEDEEEILEEKKRKEEEAALKAEQKKAEEAAAKAEKKARMEAARGKMLEDEEADEIDVLGEKEYKDRLERHEVELAFAKDTNRFEAKPLNAMEPSTDKEFELMGQKMGNCIKTFRSSKFFLYALNSLLTRCGEKMDVEDVRSLSAKLDAKLKAREAEIKAGLDKKTTGPVEEDRGNAVQDGENMGRNDLVGDGDREFDDFM